VACPAPAAWPLAAMTPVPALAQAADPTCSPAAERGQLEGL
jgi:hypothetical protein